MKRVIITKIDYGPNEVGTKTYLAGVVDLHKLDFSSI